MSDAPGSSQPPASALHGQLRLPAVLLAAVLGINAAAVWGILASRRAAERTARDELRLQTELQARGLEAALATLRGDLVLLARSRQLAGPPDAAPPDDPLVRRWRRLDVESALLLFLAAHPEVTSLGVGTEDGAALARAARRDGAPVIVAPDHGPSPPPPEAPALEARFPTEGAGPLVARIDTRALLARAAPGLGHELTLTAADASNRTAPPEVSATVTDAGWDPPIAWRLVRRATPSPLVASVAALAARYRVTVLLNLAVMGLAVVLGALAFRELRRGAALDAARREQARIRALEQQLAASERLAAVGQLAAGLAHEINNPLEGMANYLSLLDEDLRAGRTEAAGELAAKLQEGLDRIAGVVRQVLAFSDPKRTPKEVLDLNVPLHDTLGFIGESARGIVFESALCPEPLPVLGNRHALGQLFMNLLLNACQWQPEGGRVAVRSDRDGDEATVSIVDHGPGIAPEALPHVFEPFFSARGSTGLGLSVCHGIVSEHGGRIDAANAPGAGATFRVALPLARDGARAAPPWELPA